MAFHQTVISPTNPITMGKNMANTIEDRADIYILNLRASGMPSVLLLPDGKKVAVRDKEGHVLGYGIERSDGRTGSVSFLARKPFTEEEIKDVPTVLYFQRSDRSASGDFATQSSALVLSKKAADVLQRIEPGKHQYFPLKVKAAKRYQDKLQAMGHVVVNVCQTAQVVVIEKSELKPHVMTPPAPYPSRTFYHLGSGPSQIIVDPTKAEGLHIWGGGAIGVDEVLYQDLFVSRTLKEAWDAAGCGPVGYIPCRNA
jgi:hypothetical protein